MNTVINNAIIQSDLVLPIIKKSSNVKLTASNNYVANDVSPCQFVNYAEDDFHLLSSSPLINAGANVLSYGVEFDYYGTQRPSADAFAIGATEY
jgi:hypothetical protein